MTITLETHDCIYNAPTLERVFACEIEDRQRLSGPLHVDQLEDMFADFQCAWEWANNRGFEPGELHIAGASPRTIRISDAEFPAIDPSPVVK